MENFNKFPASYMESVSCIKPFEMQRLPIFDSESDCHLKTHSLNHYSIIWIVNGPGNYPGINQLTISNDQFLFVNPDQLASIKFNANIKGYLISFNRHLFDFNASNFWTVQVGKLFTQNLYLDFTEEEIEDLQNIMRFLIKEFNKHTLNKNEIIRHYFNVFLIYLSGKVQPEATSPYSRDQEIYQNFNLLVNQNFRTKKMVFDYANQLSITPNYLNHLIKKLTGYSAGYHIRQRIATEAKLMATQSNPCMKSIAYNLGFDDLAHFSKFFKNTTGSKFTDFKKNVFISQVA